MAEQDLNGAEIDAGFEQMGSEGVAQQVRMNRLCRCLPLARSFRQARKIAFAEMGRPGRAPGNSQSVGRRLRQ